MATLQQLLDQAVDHHRSGRLDAARALYAAIVSYAPQLGDPARLLALLLRREDPPRAAALARQAAAIDPAAPWALWDLGLVLKDAGHGDEALRALSRADRIGAPSLPTQALTALGLLLQAAKRRSEAENAWRRALAAQPDHGEAWLMLGLSMQENGGADAALAGFRGALACDPAMPEALSNLAVVSHQEGRLHDALKHCRRLLRLRPGHPSTHVGLGRIALALGDLTQAETAFDAALRRFAAALPAADAQDAQNGLARIKRYRAAAQAAGQPVAGEPAALPGLVARGAFRDTSGYAHMVRRFIRGVTARRVAVDLIDLNVDFVPLMAANNRDPALERLDQPIRARSALTFAIPSVMEPIPGLATINFSMFEAAQVPASWPRYAAAASLVIVPTQSSLDAWRAAGFPADRLRLCPLGVDPAPADVPAAACIDNLGRRLSDYRVRVINVSDMVDRKNIDGLLRVWFRVTRAGDDAALLLKLGKGLAEDDRRAWPFIQAVARSVGKEPAQAAPVFLTQGVLSERQMASLHAACTHYFSMSHGEGWDLPATQAGATGLTLIAPDHSAYAAYLHPGVAHMIPARPAPATPPYHGMTWWTPDEDAAAQILSDVIAGRAAPLSAKTHLLERFSWEAACDRLLEILRDSGGL